VRLFIVLLKLRSWMILYFYIAELLNSEKNSKVKDQNFWYHCWYERIYTKNSESFLDFQSIIILL